MGYCFQIQLQIKVLSLISFTAEEISQLHQKITLSNSFPVSAFALLFATIVFYSLLLILYYVPIILISFRGCTYKEFAAGRSDSSTHGGKTIG